MNWIIVSILGLILVLVPTCLAIALCVFRDTHEYDAHYNENGYSQVARTPAEEKTANPQPPSMQSTSTERAVSEWPEEL